MRLFRVTKIFGRRDLEQCLCAEARASGNCPLRRFSSTAPSAGTERRGLAGLHTDRHRNTGRDSSDEVFHLAGRGERVVVFLTAAAAGSRSEGGCETRVPGKAAGERPSWRRWLPSHPGKTRLGHWFQPLQALAEPDQFLVLLETFPVRFSLDFSGIRHGVLDVSEALNQILRSFVADSRSAGDVSTASPLSASKSATWGGCNSKES